MRVYTINEDLLEEEDTSFKIPIEVQKALSAVRGDEADLASKTAVSRDRFFPITAEARAHEELRRQEEARLPRIGDTAEDGWKYCGISPETGEPMYVCPDDWPGFDWYWAESMSEVLTHEKKQKVRLPTEIELMQVFENKEVIGNFNKCADDYGVWYFTSTPAPMTHYDVMCQNFETGAKSKMGKSFKAPIRFVRN